LTSVVMSLVVAATGWGIREFLVPFLAYQVLWLVV
jgi:hypothetical protein